VAPAVPYSVAFFQEEHRFQSNCNRDPRSGSGSQPTVSALTIQCPMRSQTVIDGALKYLNTQPQSAIIREQFTSFKHLRIVNNKWGDHSRVIISSNCLLLCSGGFVHSSVGWADGNSVANDIVVMVTCHVVTGDLLSIASTDSNKVPHQ